jgi:hypothetical protein
MFTPEKANSHKESEYSQRKRVFKLKASGAYFCFALDEDAKEDNAQNYAWFTGVSPSNLNTY